MQKNWYKIRKFI